MKMGTNQQFSLRWNNYVQHITCAFDNLRSDEDLVDVTLSCEGKKILAHKMLLSACSTYFKNVFKENPCKHPVIIFRNVKFEDLVAIVDFMYHGEVNVEQEQLSSFLTTAEMLAVQGLTDGSGSSKDNYKDENRRRHPSLLESSLLGAVQDLSNNRPNHQQKTTTPRSNIPHPSGASPFYNQSQSNRPSTPTTVNRKRKFSPVKVVNSISSKESSGETDVKQNKKKIVTSSIKEEVDSGGEAPIVPKVEVNDFDDNDSSYSEQESGMMDVSQLMDKSVDKDSVELFSTNSRDSPHPAVKGDGVPGSEIDKGLASITDQAMLKPGTSGNVESLQEPIFVEMEEEYLEEDIRSETDLDTQSEYIVIEEDVGEAEYLEEDDDDDDDDKELEETEEEEELKALLKGDSESPMPQDVEFIYAEGVSDNNEIIIGEVPRFTCKYCDASFKRLDSLYKHNSVHKGKTICPVCKAVFSRVAHRTRHMRLKHPDVEVIKPGKRGPRRKKEKEMEIKIEDQSDAFSILSAL